MTAMVFESRALPLDVRETVRARLHAAHREAPFSSVRPRATVRRVAAITESVGLDTTVFRGGVDLRGSEVDHVWLAVRAPDGVWALVIDAAFPLFSDSFVDVLRRFVAGDAPAEDVEAVAVDSGVDERVLGVFPDAVGYVGKPVWTALHG